MYYVFNVMQQWVICIIPASPNRNLGKVWLPDKSPIRLDSGSGSLISFLYKEKDNVMIIQLYIEIITLKI